MGVALVTGASRGIGRAIAVTLAEEGHDIGVGYGTREDAAGELVDRLRADGRRAAMTGGDLAEPTTAESMCDEIEAELGDIDILIANAGINTPPRPVEDIDLDEWDRILSVNLRAPFLLARRLMPKMIERGFGRIVLISSVAAYTGGVIGAHYAASKAGLHGLCHRLSQQGAGNGVTVNVVAPALVETDLMPDDPEVRRGLESVLPVGRLGRVEEVADMVAAVVRNGYLTNQSILLDGGWHPT